MASLRHHSRRIAGNSGAQLVEMAIVVPILFILIAGMVDFAFLLQSFAVVTNAAREGARVGVLPGYQVLDIQGRVLSYVTSAGLSGNPTACTPSSTPLSCNVSNSLIDPGGGGAAFPAVSVRVSYIYQYLFIGPMVSLIGRTFLSSTTVESTSVMRVEVAP